MGRIKVIVQARVNAKDFIIIKWDTGQLYELSIKHMGGIAEAIKHLRYKKWFTDEVEQSVMESYNRERFNIFNEVDKKMFSSDFFEYVQTIHNKPGCYRFRTFVHGDYIEEYIGVSEQIGKRVLSSFEKRCRMIDEPVYAQFYFTKTVADAYCLEPFLINKYKPAQNKQYKASDELTLTISYDESKCIEKLCNNIT